MKVGIIGLGSIAQKHITALESIVPDVEFYALRHSRTAGFHGNAVNVFSYDELIGCRPDFIIISNPTAYHYDTITKLAGTDIPLFIEKPLFDKLYPLPDLKQTSYVACNLRFLDCLNYVKQSIVGVRVNEVNAYCGSYLPQWRADTNWRECYSANKNMGGGVHIDLIHEIDYLYWLFGAPKRVRKTFRNVSSLGITAYDYANYTMEYGKFTVSAILNYYRRDYKRTLEVLTDTDTWSVDLKANCVSKNGDMVFSSNQQFADTYAVQMTHFLSTITGGEKFNDINEGYKVLTICLNDEIGE